MLIRGLYYPQLKGWLDQFGPSQFAVVNSDAFYADPVAVALSTIKFLAPPAAAKQPCFSSGCFSKAQKSAPYVQNRKTPPGTELHGAVLPRLQRLYAPYNDALYTLLRRNGVPFVPFKTRW